MVREHKVSKEKQKQIKHKRKRRRIAATRLMILFIFAISLGVYYLQPEVKTFGDSKEPELETVQGNTNETDKGTNGSTSTGAEESKNKDKSSFWSAIKSTKKDIKLVNRDNLLKKNYVPSDLVNVDINFSPDATDEEHYMSKEAAAALKELVHGAENEGIHLYGLSGYRSYETQDNLYNYNLTTQGYDYANQYVAQAGASEHQSGLAMDLATQVGWISEGCEEAIWLADNAYKYGYIVRYEKGKEDITGYSYEPWHIRYVGKKAAKEIYNKGITLEEYCEQ